MCRRSGIGQMRLFLRCCQLCQHAEVLQRRRVPGDLCAAGNFLEEPSHDFAAARFWKRFGKTHFIGFRNCANVLADMIAQFILQPAARLQFRFSLSQTRRRPGPSIHPVCRPPLPRRLAGG